MDRIAGGDRDWTRSRIREVNALQARRRHGDRPATGRGLQRARGAARRASRRSDFHAQARRHDRDRATRDRLVALLPRLRVHGQRRGQAGVEGHARAHGDAGAHPASPARRSARARARCWRRSSPTRSASVRRHRRCTMPTPAAVPDSGPTVASRTCMVVGRHAASGAARDARHDRWTLTPASTICATHGPLVGDRSSTSSPAGLEWDDVELSRRRVRDLRLGAATSPRWRSIRTPARCARRA